MVSVTVRYLFYQPMDEKIKTWTLRLPNKESPNMEKALFDRPIVLQYDLTAKYRLISRKFFGHEVFAPVRLLFLPWFRRFHFKVIRKSLETTVKTKIQVMIAVKINLPIYSKILNMK